MLTNRLCLVLLSIVASVPSARAAAVSAGSSHSAVVKTTDGTAWTFGYNGSGRLGDNTSTERTLPTQVVNLTSVSAVSAGDNHTLVLKTDGTVWSFGANTYGQLGDGTTTQRLAAVQVKANSTTNVTGITAIAAGASYSLALKSDGTVVGWGANGSGQLGNGTTSTGSNVYPVAVNTVTGITAIAAGYSHSLAVKSDGTAWAWGSNVNGRLGDGTTTQRTSPVQVSGLTGATAVAAGDAHSLARKSDGTLMAWGLNTYGRLGDGTTTQRTSPVAVSGLTEIVAVSAGAYHSVAAASDGVVFAWGNNRSGRLGDGTTTDSALPVMLTGISDAIAIVAAGEHTLAVTSQGVVWAWGLNDHGQLGDGTTDDRLSPVSISETSFAWKVGTPVITPGSKTASTTFNATLSCATAAATIRYTTDGSDPTTSSSTYSAAISITQSTTLKARAWKASVPTSNVNTATYELKVVAPSLSPGTGTYSTLQNVTMTTTTSGATIRQTTDGSDPTDSSTAYSSAVAVDATTTLKARAFKTGWTASDPTSRTYTMKIGTPSFSPGSGSYSAVQQVVVSTVTPSATLHYSTTGLEPQVTDPTVASGGTVTVDHSLTLRVKGWRTGWSTSDTGTASYGLSLGAVASPTFTPTPGTYGAAQTVSIATATSGATIRYSLDGADPMPASPIFAAPVVVSGTTTVKARAYKADMSPSSVASGLYTINLGAVETPTLSLASGAYTTSQAVTANVGTSGANIHYTTTGSDPTEADAVVASGGTVSVDRAMIVKAKAWKAGLPASEVVRRDYRITGAIAAGGHHSLALKADGTAWSWGYNVKGQLGDTTTTLRNSPVQVATLTGLVAIAAGDFHSLFLKSDGTVFGCGNNFDGQVGDTTTTSRSTAVQAVGVTGAVAIAAGTSHSLALKSDGTVMSWGDNSAGQLGINSLVDSSTPVAVSGLTGVVAIAAGANHSLALKSDGTVVAWGLGADGQIGDGFNLTRKVPTAVVGLAGISRLAGGGSFSLALRGAGPGLAMTLWSWGENSLGQLGDRTTTAQNTPISPISQLAMVDAGENHTLGMAADGTLWGWGADPFGQLGDGLTIATGRLLPMRVLNIREALALSAGLDHSLSLGSDGRVWAFGYNNYGQLGTGNYTLQTSPVTVGSLVLASNSWLASDPDQDGLSNATEYRIGTDPLVPDTDLDGLLDGIENALGGNATSLDSDGDGLTNTQETALGTDSFRSDTDGDGTADGADCAPLDSTRWQCIADPNDHTPPVITIDTPPNATPVP